MDTFGGKSDFSGFGVLSVKFFIFDVFLGLLWIWWFQSLGSPSLEVVDLLLIVLHIFIQVILHGALVPWRQEDHLKHSSQSELVASLEDAS